MTVQLPASALDVEGMLGNEETLALTELAATVSAGRIVEIGSYRGRSTVALALGVKAAGEAEVVSIDPHFTFTGVYGGQFGPADRVAFFENLLRCGVADRVRVIELPSQEASRAWSSPIELLWIDGDHADEAVRRDFDEWEPHVVTGGMIALHDSADPELGPGRVVAAAVRSGRFEYVGRVEATTVLRKVA